MTIDAELKTRKVNREDSGLPDDAPITLGFLLPDDKPISDIQPLALYCHHTIKGYLTQESISLVHFAHGSQVGKLRQRRTQRPNSLSQSGNKIGIVLLYITTWCKAS
jgi:hypothetical protein